MRSTASRSYRKAIRRTRQSGSLSELQASALLRRARRVILQPRHVPVAGTADPSGAVEDISLRDERRRGAAIAPLADFGMAIRKGKPAGVAVVGSRQVVQLIGARVVRRV